LAEAVVNDTNVDAGNTIDHDEKHVGKKLSEALND